MTASPIDADVVVVGAGIVGLATARELQLRRPDWQVLVVDKEGQIATHQTGRNSGVVHSGVYYRPGSTKATTVAAGRRALIAYCEEKGIALERSGKVIVATRPKELVPLRELARRAAANGVNAAVIDTARLKEIEPHATGLAALHVPDAAVVDFREVARAFADDLIAAGGTILLGRAVKAIHRERPSQPNGHGADHGLIVETEHGPLRTRWAINCAGLHSDLIARASESGDASGARPDIRIIAFRGEYHELIPARRHLVRSLIYPVPDPRFPFLGVHLTRGIDGSVHVGPNAVLALAREGYRWRDLDPHELGTLVRSPALRSLARRHWRTGSGEVIRSVSRHALVRTVRRMVPEIEARDLVRTEAGVRAQAVRPDGTLLDDFAFVDDGRVTHVINAPSPAATASMSIGRHLAERLITRSES